MCGQTGGGPVGALGGAGTIAEDIGADIMPGTMLAGSADRPPAAAPVLPVATSDSSSDTATQAFLESMHYVGLGKWVNNVYTDVSMSLTSMMQFIQRNIACIWEAFPLLNSESCNAC